MVIIDRIRRLRKEMSDKGIDAYIVPSSDPHMSEYVAAHWEGRKWLSGFTGSAGTLVIPRTLVGCGLTAGIMFRRRSSLKERVSVYLNLGWKVSRASPNGSQIPWVRENVWVWMVSYFPYPKYVIWKKYSPKRESL